MWRSHPYSAPKAGDSTLETASRSSARLRTRRGLKDAESLRLSFEPVRCTIRVQLPKGRRGNNFTFCCCSFWFLIRRERVGTPEGVSRMKQRSQGAKGTQPYGARRRTAIRFVARWLQTYGSAPSSCLAPDHTTLSPKCEELSVPTLRIPPMLLPRIDCLSPAFTRQCAASFSQPRHRRPAPNPSLAEASLALPRERGTLTSAPAKLAELHNQPTRRRHR